MQADMANGNETPNTPDLSEAELRARHVDELRERAGAEGIPDVDDLRKDDLLRAISAKHRAAGATGSGGREASRGGKSQGDAKTSGGNETANTPDLSETELRATHMDELRERARKEGVRNAEELRKGELVDAISAKHRGR